MTKNTKKATPATIKVANATEGLVKVAIERGLRVTTRSKGKVLVISNSLDPQN